MKRLAMLLVTAAAILLSDDASAQGRRSGLDGELIVANYAVTFPQVFLGKVIRGENVASSFVQSLYEAVPAAAAQYAGMKMVGENWQLALPAQLLVQKGAAIQRRSISGEPVFSRELLTSWDLDYLWFNLRVRNGRILSPRLNVATVAATAIYSNGRLNLERSFTTGVIVFSNSREVSEGTGGFEMFGTIHDFSSADNWDDESFSHELIHRFQGIRESAIPEVLLRQDSERGWPISFLRFNLTLLYPSYRLQRWWLNGSQFRWRIFHEWEAGAYSGYKWWYVLPIPGT